MASGDPVVLIHEVSIPGANGAAPGVHTGGSTPAEKINCWLFDAATIEYLDFLCELRGYGGGGLSFVILWMSAAQTTGVVRWRIAMRRLQDDAEDLDSAQTYDFNTVDATTANVAGEQDYAALTFTDGADMDSVANGEFFILRVSREANHANDTLTGDAEFITVSGRET